MNTRFALVFIALVVVLSSLAVAADDAAAGVVNINTAETEQLQLLPRVGPALAGRIIEFREAHGPFGSVGSVRPLSPNSNRMSPPRGRRP